ncbi:MAG: ORF6N domain-containing protein [Gammaproteobacteria bacterium]
MNIIKQVQVQEKIVKIRNQQVIIDADVAELYGVETKRINEAVKNNPEKFPTDYLIELTREEWEPLKSKFSSSMKGGKVKLPTGFTERGLYMLATILKSPKAVETTLAIVDTFAKVRELSQAVNQIQTLPENSPKHKSLIEHTGDLIADLIIPENELEVTGTETTYEMNFAVFKIKRTVKKSKQT